MSKHSAPGLAIELSSLPTSTSTPQIQQPADEVDNDPIPPKPHDAGRCNIPRHRFLTQAEWLILAHGVGSVKDAENQAPLHPVSSWWPPKGLPPGLYRDIVYERTKAFYMFHFTSTVRWGLMIMQLLIGASLTGLGSLSLSQGTSITILGAANTVIAGLLAFLHNSGLPDRFGCDKAEFEDVEDHIREILDTAMVPADHSIDQALAECFALYHRAKATVLANKPVTYTKIKGQQRAGRGGSIPTGVPGAIVPMLTSKVSGTGLKDEGAVGVRAPGAKSDEN
ncbi:hypothetical protein AK830_g11497 [Neonectria ditissima]|uniref:SMODS and SLOG-associating 2TM effector domain-containing protein n=1 Tax=Neonectria ditissima TaxID=78410 RepID=A0A0P7AR65_9HYPO|nr:hypothetical protein AK830_g11497 [Neonectria ditissima]